jgi:hypothetical protein
MRVRIRSVVPAELPQGEGFAAAVGAGRVEIRYDREQVARFRNALSATAFAMLIDEARRRERGEG